MSDPPSPSSPPPAPDFRASDAERERAVELLRHAATEGRLSVDELDERAQAAYRVQTRAELERLLADVSETGVVPVRGSATAASGAAGTVAVVPDGPTGTRHVTSILGGHDRSGRWRVAERLRVTNILGGSEIDLCEAELSGPVTEIRVLSVMGGGEIRVPDGVEVEVSQFAFMGGNDVRLGDARPGPGAPVIRLRLVSIMGGVSVERGLRQTRAERRAAKELRRETRRAAHELRHETRARARGELSDHTEERP